MQTPGWHWGPAALAAAPAASGAGAWVGVDAEQREVAPHTKRTKTIASNESMGEPN